MSEKKLASMAEVKATNDVEYDYIQAFKKDEWFRIQSLSADEFIKWAEAGEGIEDPALKREAKRTAGLRLIVKSLVDEQGKLTCADADIEVWRGKQHKTTQRIVKAILKMNGIETKADKDEKND